MTRIAVTLFRNEYAKSKREVYVTPEELADGIARTSAPTKAKLPLLKLGTFGDKPSPTGSGCLRYNANLSRVSGVELDYDGEEIGFDDALWRLRRIERLAIIYTSRSHLPLAPRWRVLLPFGNSECVETRKPTAEQVQWELGVEFARESFIDSQAFYYGRVAGDPHFRIELVDGPPIVPVIVDAEPLPAAVPLPAGIRANCSEVTPYATAALGAVMVLCSEAEKGEQSITLIRECRYIGNAVAAGMIPEDYARDYLGLIADDLPDLDPERPWRAGEARRRAMQAFAIGMKSPRARQDLLAGYRAPDQEYAHGEGSAPG